jgi:hypothetical protein
MLWSGKSIQLQTSSSDTSVSDRPREDLGSDRLAMERWKHVTADRLLRHLYIGSATGGPMDLLWRCKSMQAPTS